MPVMPLRAFSHPADQRILELQERLRRLGLPLVLEPEVRARGMLLRSAGMLAAVAQVFIGLSCIASGDRQLLDLVGPNEVDLDAVSTEELLLALLIILGAVLVLIAPLTVWLVGALVRRVPRRPGSVLAALAALAVLAGPVLLFPPEDRPALWQRAGTLLLVLLLSYAGAGAVLRWATRRVTQELWTLGPMVSRVLPVLMIAVLFFFYNAEIWQVTVSLAVSRTWFAVGTIGTLTVLLVVATTQDDLRSVLAEHDAARAGTSAAGTSAAGTGWVPDPAPYAPDEGDEQPAPLRRAERLNLLLVPCTVSVIQTLLFGTVVFAFFVFFGWLSVSDATAAQWTGAPTTRATLLTVELPVSGTLIKVSLMLAGFAALNFAASAGADRAHRERFVEPLLEEVVDGLRTRDEYVRARRAGTPPA